MQLSDAGEHDFSSRLTCSRFPRPRAPLRARVAYSNRLQGFRASRRFRGARPGDETDDVRRDRSSVLCRARIASSRGVGWPGSGHGFPEGVGTSTRRSDRRGAARTREKT